MLSRFFITAFFFVLFGVAPPGFSADPGSLDHWVVEQAPGGKVFMHDGALVIQDAGGCTVWWREKLTQPVEISYEATVVSQGGPYDRVSDLNCFWMAREADAADRPPFGRAGRFSEYNSLLTYYVGYGGNNNTTTRFRRYDGTDARPILPEHDLRAPAFLLEANRPYRIKLIARNGVAEYWRDGQRIFAYADHTPLRAGWFAFRTVKSHMVIRNFQVRSLSETDPNISAKEGAGGPAKG